MRTIFVRVTDQTSPSYAPVLATPITSTTFSIDSVHPDYTDASLEFGAGDSVRRKVIRAAGTSSSSFFHRHARASSLTSVPSGCGFEVGASSLPSGATMRLRPLRCWNRIGMRTTSRTDQPPPSLPWPINRREG